MKQSLIGIGIFGVLIVYSLGIRHEAPVIARPSSLTSTPTTPTGTPVPASSGTPGPSPAGNSATPTPSPTSAYKDGTYTGSVADAYYGSVQVQATIAGGKLTGVRFLQYPNTHSTSVVINQQAMPYLQQEAIAAQAANVQIISGATFTSQAFEQSLGQALQQAQS